MAVWPQVQTPMAAGQPTDCTPTVSVTKQHRCSCSSHLRCYISAFTFTTNTWMIFKVQCQKGWTKNLQKTAKYDGDILLASVSPQHRRLYSVLQVSQCPNWSRQTLQHTVNNYFSRKVFPPIKDTSQSVDIMSSL